MATTLTCPQGHRWDLSELETALTPGECFCPVCGDPPLTVSPDALSPSACSTAPWQAASGGDGQALTIPGYEILGELGRGGMGVVYRARQEKLKRLVALKMILPGAQIGPEQLARFRSEAEAVARLQHPNIVQIYEIGEHEGRPFFSLEYVDGGSLAQQTAGTPVPAGTAAALTRTLAEAMHYAHERGIVHRDLKPANILLQEEFSQRRKGAKEASQEEGHEQRVLLRLCENSSFLPKITDFGLAKQLEEESGQTRSGAIMGTPSYMAPEQAEGRTKEIGPLADVYALGAILYELLTGRPPFKGATVLDTLDLVRNQEPVPPSRLQPGVARDLELICLKCLRKEPDRRYASAAELTEELRRFLAGEPLFVTRPVGRAERLYRWCCRHPARAAAAVLALLLLIAAVVVPVAFAVREGRHGAEMGEALTEKSEALTEKGKALTEKEYQLAENHHDKGFGLCESGEQGQGMLWMALALENLPPGSGDLERVIRISLAAWAAHLNTLKAMLVLEHPAGEPIPSPDGRLLAVRRQGGLLLYETATGKPIGPVLDDVSQAGPRYKPIFSPDGRKLLTRGRNGETLDVWDITTGRRLLRQPVKGTEVLAAAFGPDGHLLVAFGLAESVKGKNKKVRVKRSVHFLDADTGRPPGPDLPIAASPQSWFTRDGTGFLAVQEHATRLWDVATGQALGPVLPYPEESVRRTALSPDGKAFLLSTHRMKGEGSAELVRLWDVPGGKLVGEPIVAKSPLAHYGRPLAFSADSKTFAVSTNVECRFFETATGKPVGVTLPAALHELGPDGRLAVTGNSFRKDRPLGVAQGQPVGQPLALEGRDLAQCVPLPDGRTLVTGQNRTLRVWELARGNAPFATLPHQHFTMLGGKFAPDGSTLLTSGDDFAPRLWDAVTGQPLRFPGPGMGTPLAISPDGRLALLADSGPNDNGRLTGGWFCDLTTGARRGARLSFGDNNAITAAFRPDGGAVLTGTDATPDFGVVSAARLWDAATGLPLGAPVAFSEGVYFLTFSPDGRTALAASRDGSVVLLDGATGRPLGDPLRTSPPVRAVAFRSDGQTFVVSSNVTQIYETASRRPAGDPLPDPAILSPDGQYALARERLWKVGAWKPLGRQPLQDARFGRFTPDGRVFVSGRAWDTATGKPLGPPFPRESHYAHEVSSDNRTFLTALSANAYLTRLPAPLPGTPERVRLWVQVSTGLELDPDKKVVRPLDAVVWQERKRRLDDLGGPPAP